MKPYSELSGRERAIEVLRWMLVPVAAVAAVYALIVIARVARPPMMAQLPGTPAPVISDFQRWVVPRIINGLIAVAFVFAGAKVAPRRRLATALVLAALWIGYSLLIHVVIHLGQGKPHYLDFAIAAAAALLAVALVRYSERAGQRFAKPSSD